jgi:hypothetical protein
MAYISAGSDCRTGNEQCPLRSQAPPQAPLRLTQAHSGSPSWRRREHVQNLIAAKVCGSFIRRWRDFDY